MPSASAWRGEAIGVAFAVDQDASRRPAAACPDSMPISVDFPAPFSPSSTCTSPALDRQVDAVVGDDAGKPFGHALKRDDAAWPDDEDDRHGAQRQDRSRPAGCGHPSGQLA